MVAEEGFEPEPSVWKTDMLGLYTNATYIRLQFGAGCILITRGTAVHGGGFLMMHSMVVTIEQ